MMILFDMDGTLVDVSDSYRRVIAMTVEGFSGRGVSAAEIQSFKDGGGCNNDWDLCESILKERGLSVPYEQIVGLFQDLYWGKGPEPDGLIRQETWLLSPKIMQELAENYPLGIVTGRPRREALWTLEHFSVSCFFQILVAHEDCPPGRGKPDPYGLKLAMSRLSQTSGVYVGDSPDDRLAAQAAGLFFVGALPSGVEYPGCFTEGRELILANINGIMEAL